MYTTYPYSTAETQLDLEVRDQWERLAALQRRRTRYRHRQAGCWTKREIARIAETIMSRAPSSQ